MAKNQPLCPECGAFVRMAWTDTCEVCDADLAHDEIVEVKIPDRNAALRIALDRLSRPTSVIAMIIGVVIMGALAVTAYTTATLSDRIDKVVAETNATAPPAPPGPGKTLVRTGPEPKP